MSALKNPRHETFCQQHATGKSCDIGSPVISLIDTTPRVWPHMATLLPGSPNCRERLHSAPR